MMKRNILKKKKWKLKRKRSLNLQKKILLMKFCELRGKKIKREMRRKVKKFDFEINTTIHKTTNFN